MYTEEVDMESLFEQLGLDASEKGQADFFATHCLEKNAKLTDAAFWNKAQSVFLQEALSDDSDWAEVVDQLSNRLRPN